MAKITVTAQKKTKIGDKWLRKGDTAQAEECDLDTVLKLRHGMITKGGKPGRPPKSQAAATDETAGEG